MINKPLIIEIKGNSLDDGPGVRSTIFFKGCPLSCIWCHNPESKKANSELSWDIKTCIGDGGCLTVCKNDALNPLNPGFVDRNKCELCFKCVDFCPAKALTKSGFEWEIEEVLKKVKSDKPFYKVSGGGVTLSGGEATLFSENVGKLAKAIHDEGIDILLETCGYFNYEDVKANLLPYIKDIYCDIKIYDRENHKKYCGVYNDKILENIEKLYVDSKEIGFTLLPRIPLIPGITDTDENLTSIAEFINKVGIEKVELLPYNPTWYSKSDKIGVKVDSQLIGIDHFQDKEMVEHAKDIFRERNIIV